MALSEKRRVRRPRRAALPNSNVPGRGADAIDVTAQSENRDELREEVERRIGPLLPAGPSSRQVVESVISFVMEETFSGPIPHPRHFAQYEMIVPGSADRLIKMAEQQLAHNTKISQDAMSRAFDDQRLGMILGFAALSLLIMGAGLSIFLESEIGAGLFLGAGALGIVGMFVKRNTSKN